MRIVALGLSLALLMSMASTSEASILFSLLDFDGTADKLDDDSAGIFIERGTVDDTLEVGDVVMGIVELRNIDGTDVSPNSVFAAYSFEIAPGGIGAGGTSLAFKAATGAENILSVLGAAGVTDARNNTDLNGILDGSDGVAFAILENTAESTLGDTTTDGTIGSVGANFDSTWKTTLTAGFDGVDDAYVISSIFGSDLTDLAAFGALPPGFPVAFFHGAFTVSGFKGASSTVFQPIPNGVLGAEGDITIEFGTITKADAVDGPNGWAFSDEGDYFIDAVPEPATIAIWSVIGLGGCAVAARRRFKKKAA